MKTEFLARPAECKQIEVPLVHCSIAAGFPSPADDYVDQALDLNELLVTNPPATFFVRVNGDSMIDAGIHHGDILSVDRSEEAHDGSIVIARITSYNVCYTKLLRMFYSALFFKSFFKADQAKTW